MAAVREPRRTKLATIVGSGLAVVAAGSLLAFSTLAEQAGLEGLATGRVEPARPARTGAHAITIPAPSTAPPSDPRGLLEELVRGSVNRTVTEPQPRVAFVVTPPEPPAAEKPEKPHRRRVDDSARVAVVEPEVEEPVEAGTDSPPYGHAYGHYKNRPKDKDKPKHSKPGKKRESKDDAPDQPVYARSANEESDSKPPKAPKLEKVKKDKKQTSPSNGNGKAKGHSKHAHKGKGKGHSKHGG